MTWLILFVAALIAGTLAGSFIAPLLARRFPKASNKWLAIGAASIVPALIVVVAAVVAATEYDPGNRNTSFGNLAASLTFYVGLLCAFIAGAAGELAALWALRRTRS